MSWLLKYLSIIIWCYAIVNFPIFLNRKNGFCFHHIQRTCLRHPAHVNPCGEHDCIRRTCRYPRRYTINFLDFFPSSGRSNRRDVRHINSVVLCVAFRHCTISARVVTYWPRTISPGTNPHPSRFSGYRTHNVLLLHCELIHTDSAIHFRPLSSWAT